MLFLEYAGDKREIKQNVTQIVVIIRTHSCVNHHWTIKSVSVHSPSPFRGPTMKHVKYTTHRAASLPLVLMHVAFITFLTLSMVMSLPTLR